MKGLGRVAIVGCGAVGIYYGSRIAASGEDVHFLLRSDYDEVKRNGFKITSVHGDLEINSPNIYKSSEEIGVVDLVIIAWKATANAKYEEVIRPLVHDETKILTLQNGLGNVEYLAELFGSERIYGGLCFVCINRVASGCVNHSASGMIRLGLYEDRGGCSIGKRNYLKFLAERFQHSKIKCEAVDSLEEAQWKKLVWNIPFNGLAIAEGGVDTRCLLHELNKEQEVRAIMHEVAQIALKLGYEISNAFIDQQVELTLNMGAYKPSSMIDFVEGKDVEVTALFDEPLRRAKKLGVKTPNIERLVFKVKNQLSLR